MIVGIDLGTTNSLIACFEDGKARLLGPKGKEMTPSVISHVEGALTVGLAARNRIVSNPNETAAVFKRSMGTEKTFSLGKGQSFGAVDLSAMVLRELKAQAETELGVGVSDAVISVPAYFNQIQRKAVNSAAQIAGLNPLRLINEPTAAAIAYGLQSIGEEGHILVFDLGGGTFDVSIIEVFEGVIEVKATAGDAFLGGEDFTDAICDHIGKEHGLDLNQSDQRAVIWGVAETLKHRLSESQTATLTAEVGGQERTFSLSRDAFDEACSQLVQRLRLPVERAIHDARLSREEIDRVVLVGGATRMPMIRGLVTRLTHKMPEIGIDPDHVVALGAAIQAGLIEKDEALDDVVMTDVTAFSLGIESAQQMGEHRQTGFFSPIIERNTMVPVSREETFSAMEKNQRQLRVAIYQGESALVKDNIKLGEMELNLPRNPDGYESVAVRFTYDVSGLLEVDAQVLSSGQTTSTVITELAGNISEADIRKRQKALSSLKVHPKDMEENVLLASRIERCYAAALSEDRHVLQKMLLSFNAVIARQNPSEIEAVRKDISAQLDQFEASYVR